MDKIKAMEAFVGVVDTGGFTRAAELLGQPKASVSASISELEAHLKVRLLHRTTRRVTVTADGAAFYERCVRILEDLRDAEETFSSRQASPSGRLRVDVPSPFARMLLIPALPAFYARYPEIQLTMGVSDRLIDIIGENVDCVVRGGEITDQSLIARHVGDLQLGIYATPGYLQRAGTPMHPAQTCSVW